MEKRIKNLEYALEQLELIQFVNEGPHAIDDAVTELRDVLEELRQEQAKQRVTVLVEFL